MFVGDMNAQRLSIYTLASQGWHACLVLFAAATFAAALPAAAADAAGSPPPRFLSETGLFVAGSTGTIAPGVLSFSPQYPLWSDGAKKRRWISLPPGSVIDATRPDAWEFPAGTRLWKEFSLGRRVETRMIDRLADGSWRFAVYVWKEDGSDAELAPSDGIRAFPVAGAPSGRYPIPSETDCRACHEGTAVPVLGFSALQLSPDRDPKAPHAEPLAAGDVDLRVLVDRGLLRNLPAGLIEQPPRIAASSAEERAALGYLHGNCGHCHNDPHESGAGVPVELRLAQHVARPDSADAVLRSLIGTPSRFRSVDTHSTERAEVMAMRMRSRDPRVQMPPLGTQITDSQSLSLIERWISHYLTTSKEPRP
jgi:hypothetical protein